MSAHRGWLLLGAALAALLILLATFAPWWASEEAQQTREPHQVARGAAVPDAPGAVAGGQPEGAPFGPPTRSTAGRDVIAVRVVGDTGMPASGELIGQSITSPTGFNPVDPAAPFRARFVGGVGEIQVDGRYPTWVLASLDGTLATRGQTRVAPFSGRVDIEVPLAAERTALHVQVLDHELQGPVGRTRVIVEQVGQLASVDRREAETDADGYALFLGCSGELSVRTEHAAPIDASPWRRVVQVAPRCEAAETFLTIAKPLPRRTVSLDITVQGLGEGLLGGPRLFARDLSRGELIPIRQHLRMGVQRLEVQLLDGDYDFDAVPLGQVQVATPEGTLTVGPGTASRVKLHVSSNEARTMTVLRGVDADEFPLRVTLRSLDNCPAVGQELLAVGPTAWHLAAQNLPSVPRPHQVVVFSRRRALVSRSAVALQGASIEVDLIPATAVRVHWAGATTSPVLTVAALAGSLVVPLRADIVRAGARDEVAWVAQVVVPCGHTVFDCGDATGRQLWSRSIELSERATVLP